MDTLLDMPKRKLFPSHVLISAQEAEDLMAYMRDQYLNQNKHPQLHALLQRLDRLATGVYERT